MKKKTIGKEYIFTALILFVEQKAMAGWMVCVILARELAKRIESELEYPGQIKVHVLRETKVIEYAK